VLPAMRNRPPTTCTGCSRNAANRPCSSLLRCRSSARHRSIRPDFFGREGRRLFLSPQQVFYQLFPRIDEYRTSSRPRLATT
jgi:hypothetical protein